MARRRNRFPELVKAARVEAGLSQEDLAARMREVGHPSWHQTTVSKMEAGSRPTSFDEALSLAEVVGRHLVDLLDFPNLDTRDAAVRAAWDRARARLEEARRAHEDATRRLRAAEAWLAEAERA